MSTEYDYIDFIGTTHETYSNETERKLKNYYHKQEVGTVSNLLKKMKFNNYESVLDLGSSIGTWYSNYRKFGFKKIIGIDISKERAKIAKKRGYDEIHVCNAKNLPFENGSINCIISNDVLVHVLQDADKLAILKEVKRVLKENGIFIFCIPNALGFGYKIDTTLEYCRYSRLETITNMLNETGLTIEYIEPSYYRIPRIGVYPILVPITSSFVFLIIDYLLKKLNNLTASKVVYFGVRKTNTTN